MAHQENQQPSGSPHSVPSSGFPSEGFGLKPQLDNIFEEVERSLPSIDFDLSDVSSDEDVAIFQRPLQQSAITDDDKDMDESLMSENWDDVLGLSRNSVAASQTSDAQTQSDLLHDTQASSREASKPPKLAWAKIEVDTGCQTSTQELKREEVPELSPQDYGSLNLKKSEKEVEPDGDNNTKKNVRRLRRHNQGVRESSREVVSRFLPSQAPLLNIEGLEATDLDDLLSAREDTASRSRLTTSIGSLSIYEAGGHLVAPQGQGDEMSLVEKLAQLSSCQSGQELSDIDPVTGALKVKRPSAEEIKEAKTTINTSLGAAGCNKQAESSETKVRKNTASAGTNTSDLHQGEQMSAAASKLTLGHQEDESVDAIPTPPRPEVERETIFLDLRNFEEVQKEQRAGVERVQKVLQLTPRDSSDFRSDSDSGDELENWREERKKIRASIERTGSAPVLKTVKQERHRDSRPRSPKSRDASMRAQKLARKTAATPSPTVAPPTEADNLVSGDHSSIGQTVPTESEKQEAERQKRLQQARELREQREQERQTRIRLARQLDALRPQLSSKGHQPCAEATATIFDVEASYEPAPLSLPSGTPQVECVLLTVHLSSPGQMVAHRGSGGRSVDTGSGLSASYSGLLAWLLTLVPHNFDTLQVAEMEPDAETAPFCVLGIQQMYMGDQLSLFIAVSPSGNTSPKQLPTKGKKSKRKDGLREQTVFQKAVSRFLSTNTLQSVSPWLRDLVSVEVTSQPHQAAPPPGHNTFSYKPPLPYITAKPLSTFIQLNPDTQAVNKVFGIPVGFFWQTVENEESHFEQSLNDEKVNYETQNTMSLVYKKVYQDPRAMMGILARILQEGLDLAGVRLLYPTTDLMNIAAARSPGTPAVPSGDAAKQHMDMLNNIGPILSLAIRGTYARTIWLDALGPSDPTLARKTDPNSLCALFGGESRDECLLFCPRNPARITSELARWFGGRVPPSGVIDVGTDSRRGTSSGAASKSKKSVQSEVEFDVPSNRPPATLSATICAEIILAVSPLVPTRCQGIILTTCQRRGYQLRGVRRTRLSAKRANNLGMVGNQLSVFTTGGATSPGMSPFPTEAAFSFEHSPYTGRNEGPCTLLLLKKENAWHQAASLMEALMVQLSLLDLLGDIQQRTSLALSSSLLFHATPFSDTLLTQLGGDMTKVPDIELGAPPGYVAPQIYTNPELEQVVALTLTGHQLVNNVGIFLAKLLQLLPYSKTLSPSPLQQGFELLGIKWLAALNIHQARELTPYEVGDREWKKSIHTLTSEPAVVLVLRGVNALHQVASIVCPRSSHQVSSQTKVLDKIMSPTAELAYRQTTLFFHDRELFSDPEARVLAPYLPPVRHLVPADTDANDRSKRSRGHKGHGRTDSIQTESVLQTMLSGPRPITTVLVVKPNAVTKHLVKILKRIVQEKFAIVGLRLLVLPTSTAETLVPHQDRQNDVLVNMHVDYLLSGPSLVLCLQRENAVKKLLDLLGPEDPQSARRQGASLWRGIFGTDPLANAFYGSPNYQQSVKDQRHLFPSGLCCQATEDLAAEEIASPGKDDLVDLKWHTNRRITLHPADRPPGGSTSYGLHATVPNTKTSGTSTAQPMCNISSLTQTNCLVLTPSLVHAHGRSKRLPYVEIIDTIISQGCELVGARMVWLTEEQAQQYLHLCQAGSFALVPLLVSGPSLVLAIQRDNAVLTFDTLLGGAFNKESVYSKYGDHILRPKNVEQACRHLEFFFDQLVPGAQVEITPQLSQ